MEKLHHCQCLPELVRTSEFLKLSVSLICFVIVSVTPAVQAMVCFVERMQQLERANCQLRAGNESGLLDFVVCSVLTLDNIGVKHRKTVRVLLLVSGVVFILDSKVGQSRENSIFKTLLSTSL